MSCLTSQGFLLKGHRVSPWKKVKRLQSLFYKPLIYGVDLLGDTIKAVISRLIPEPKPCVCLFHFLNVLSTVKIQLYCVVYPVTLLNFIKFTN